MKKALNKPIIIHVGRKCPKGWRELPNGIHLGKGIWMLRCEPVEMKEKPNEKIT
jgi:hypothetical protein